MALSAVSDEETGQASALVSVAQNISIALAVALAGSVLQASSYLRGAELGLIDLRIAVLTAAGVSACAILFLVGLAKGADRILTSRDTTKTEGVE